MAKDYRFNAPTFFDFDPQNLNEDIEKVETYFEIDHESNCVSLLTKDAEHTSGVSSAKSENNGEVFPKSKDNISENFEGVEGVQKSIIPENLSEQDNGPTLDNSLIGKCISITEPSNVIEISDEEIDEEKEPSNLPVPDETIRKLQELNLDTKYDPESHVMSTKNNVNKDRLSKLAKPKTTAMRKYVSTAEQVNKFYGTPPRFHTWQKKLELASKRVTVQPPTLPQSPSLATRRRERKTIVLSREETEKLEVEEFRKFKIKALPINQKILQGPVKPITIAKKPATAIKPFNLTECQSKKVEQPPEPTHYEFHANPLPKTIYDKTSSVAKLDQNKKLNTRLFRSKENLKIQPVRPMSAEKSFKPSRTSQIPFSFDSRDQQIPKRRLQMVNKVLEDERKAREFRAKPPPQYVLKRTLSLTSLRTNKSIDEPKDAQVIFKAKPPLVLYQKPFEPKKLERPLLEVTEFCLNTDRRAKEREEFERKLEDKSSLFAALKCQKEMEQMRFEEEEIAKLRKETVHVSQPVRRYKELKIIPSGKVTLPVTPNFKLVQRAAAGVQNKENLM